PSPGSGALDRLLAAGRAAAAAHWPMALAVLLVGGGGVLGLALVFPGGSIATPLNAWERRALGWTAPLLAAWLTAGGVALLWWRLRPEGALPARRTAGAALASLTLIALGGLWTYLQGEPLAAAAGGQGGG